MSTLKCQCCGIEQEFSDADPEAAFRAGWDAPPHFVHIITCNLCPSTVIILKKSHAKAHALWAREGRPEHFSAARCGADEDIAF